MTDDYKDLKPYSKGTDNASDGQSRQSTFQAAGGYYNIQGNGKISSLIRWFLLSYPQSWLRRVIPPIFWGWVVSLGFQPHNHIIIALIGLLLFYRHFENQVLNHVCPKDRIQDLFMSNFESSETSKSKMPYRAFSIGYWFGFGFFVGGLRWIVNALHIDWQAFAALVPLTVLGIPGILAIGFGLVTMSVMYIAKRAPHSRLLPLLAFAIMWSLWDFTRGHILTGFPWLTVGEIWLGGDIVIQSLSLWGSYGLGLVTMLLVILLYMILAFSNPYRRSAMMLFFIIGGGLILYGQWYKASHTGAVYDDFEVVMVQPNIRQVDKWNPQKLRDNVQRLVRLSQQSQISPLLGESPTPKLYIWPEAAVPYQIESGNPIAKHITQILKPDDVLLVGSNRYVEEGAPQEPLVFNSLMALDHKGQIIGSYDKSHLVPFGEYVPLRNIMPGFVDSLAPGVGDFQKGSGLKTMRVGNFPGFSPLICYEAIFASEVIDPQDRPKWLLNITNDGWYLDSAGIYQHLHLTRMRAIEEGLSLVRVNYRGISAVFDPRGRMTAEISFDRAEGKVVKVPKANSKPTLYSQYGDKIYLVILSLLLGVILGIIIIHRNQRHRYD